MWCQNGRRQFSLLWCTNPQVCFLLPYCFYHKDLRVFAHHLIAVNQMLPLWPGPGAGNMAVHLTSDQSSNSTQVLCSLAGLCGLHFSSVVFLSVLHIESCCDVLWFIIKFTYSFFCHLSAVTESISWIFHMFIVFFNFKISISFFLRVSISLLIFPPC